MDRFYSYPTLGLLRLSGEHRVDFLQRQTTNDLRRLAPAHPVETVLTSATGRILDVFTVLHDGDTLLALCLYPAATMRFLKGRIFFMDRVMIEDISAQAVIVDAFGSLPPETSAWHLMDLQGFPPPAARLIFRADFARQGIETLAGAGGVALTPEAFAILRVEAGLPAADHELVEDYTPLEAGLAHLVADDKGCYTGQEVLARQTNYDKVTRHLVGIKLQAPAPLGAEVRVEGKPAGGITSSVVSPRLGPIALAILRRPHHQPGTDLVVGDGIGAQVVTLPFEI